MLSRLQILDWSESQINITVMIWTTKINSTWFVGFLRNWFDFQLCEKLNTICPYSKEKVKKKQKKSSPLNIFLTKISCLKKSPCIIRALSHKLVWRRICCQASLAALRQKGFVWSINSWTRSSSKDLWRSRASWINAVRSSHWQVAKTFSYFDFNARAKETHHNITTTQILSCVWYQRDLHTWWLKTLQSSVATTAPFMARRSRRENVALTFLQSETKNPWASPSPRLSFGAQLELALPQSHDWTPQQVCESQAELAVCLLHTWQTADTHLWLSETFCCITLMSQCVLYPRLRSDCRLSPGSQWMCSPM